MTKTILVVSAGDGTGLNFIRSLRTAGGYRVVGVDTSVEDFHTSEADERYLLRPPGDKFVRDLNAIIAREAVDLVYAADTGPELDAIAKHRDALAARTFLPEQEDLERTEDKWATYQVLAAHGLPVPQTRLAQGAADITSHLATFGKIWIRNRQGSGGAGAIGTSLATLACAWIDAADGWGRFTVAEHLTRRTATFSGLWHDGQLVASQLRERVGWKYGSVSVSGVTGITGAQITVTDPELHDVAVRAVRATVARPHGAIGVDFTYDSAGAPRITEIQPARFYSSMHYLAVAGINLPALYCETALFGPPAEPVINPVTDHRYWIKAVDRLPCLLSPNEYDVDAFDA